MSSLKLNTSMFMQPLHLPPSAWIGHIPFAAWLVEELRPKVLVELGTHNGASYLAFCQAVKENDLDTKCYAVDTWQGDEQAGRYGEEVFEALREIHEKHYAGFSQMLRMTFDEAAGYFADGSIDLLHIDGLHTYDAVSHDFETWLPKLSDRGVILFHDTMVRERDFGVWKFWAAISSKYPSFEFQHAYGLGILLVGNVQPESLVTLAALQRTDDNTTALRLFESLAERVVGFAEGETEHANFAARGQALKLMEQQLLAYQAQVAELNTQLGRADAYTRTQMAHAEQLARQVGDRDQRLLALEQRLAASEADAAATHSVLLSTKELASKTHAANVEELKRQVQDGEQRVLALLEKLSQRAHREQYLVAAVDRAKRRLEEMQAHEKDLQARLQASEQELEARGVELQGREMELRAAILSATEDAAAFREALQKREAELEASMRSARETAAALQEELRQREDRCLALTDEINRMSNSRSWRSTAPLRAMMRLARREQQ